MARARRLKGEEPKDHRDNPGESTPGDDTDDSEERSLAIALDSTLDRVRPREDLRSCTLCGEQDIQPERFRAHILSLHKPKPQIVPEGYYGCWSGTEFWWPLGPTKGPCKWICSVCGEVRWYWGRGNTHGGPAERLLDRRYGLERCHKGRYPNHKRYLGKIDGQAGPVVFYHEGAPNPEQPEQDGLVEEGTNAKSVQAKANTKTGGKRNSASAGRTTVKRAKRRG